MLRLRNWNWLALSFVWSYCGCNSAVKADEPPSQSIGMVSLKPSSGLCVPIDGGMGGYMVAYVHRLGETGVSFEMVPVPGGKITVGSLETEPGHRSDEQPCFEVELAPFWIGKTEVTWKEFYLFMRSYEVFKKLAVREVRQVKPSNRADAITVPTPLYDQAHHQAYGRDPDHPAVTMTQYSAKQYTKWLAGVTGIQYRLPTEAEWEYAARAGSKTAYCFGDDPSELDRYAVHSTTDGASVVASKQSNLFGLYDMHGNVWEWTIEQYSPTGFDSRGGRSFVGFDGTQWPTTVDSQCVRGGSWNDNPDRVRSAARMGSNQQDWSDIDPEVPTSPWWYTTDPSRMVGMRLVRSAKPLNKDLIAKFWDNEIVALQDDVNACLQEGRGRDGLPVPELLEELKAK